MKLEFEKMSKNLCYFCEVKPINPKFNFMGKSYCGILCQFRHRWFIGIIITVIVLVIAYLLMPYPDIRYKSLEGWTVFALLGVMTFILSLAGLFGRLTFKKQATE